MHPQQVGAVDEGDRVREVGERGGGAAARAHPVGERVRVRGGGVRLLGVLVVAPEVEITLLASLLQRPECGYGAGVVCW